MRQQNQLLFSRTRVRSRYAVLPQEGIPASRLPDWPDIKVFVQTSPAMGAQFVQYRIEIAPGQEGRHHADGRVEHFLYVLDGAASLSIGGKRHELSTGGFALIPPNADYRLKATQPTRLLLLRKIFEPLAGVNLFDPIVENASNIASEAFAGDPGAQLQLLIPDQFPYDLAMNIFTFEVGHSLPYVETHVMEHGLYFLQGKGLYYLNDTWMEVEATDFIWMGPYCPQCYYATGPVASKYIYYKNVNREIPLPGRV